MRNSGIKTVERYIGPRNIKIAVMPSTKKSNKINGGSFQLLVDGVPYFIKVIPFDFNGDIRFRVSFNDGPENIFARDPSLGRIAAIDDDGAVIPDSLEQAIAARLQAMVVG